MRVMLIAMAADPAKGSEAGVPIALLESVFRNDPEIAVTLVVPPWQGNIERIAQWRAAQGIGDRLTVVPISFVSDSERLHELGMRYVLYNLWHWSVLRYLAGRRAAPFDVLHQVNFAGYRFGSWALGMVAKSVWGPIDALSYFPLGSAWRYLTWSGRAYYGFYNAVNFAQLHLSVKTRFLLARCGCILGATSQAAALLQKHSRATVHHLRETRTRSAELRRTELGKCGPPVRIVWSGLAIHRKGLCLFVDVVRHLRGMATTAFTVDVFGEGPLLAAAKRQAEAAGLQGQVTFRGQVSRAQFLEALEQSHVLAITSFREANSSIVAEAMGKGVAPIALRVSGYADSMDESFGRLVELEPAASLAERYAGRLAEWMADEEELQRCRGNALRRAAASVHGEALTMNAIYREVMGR